IGRWFTADEEQTAARVIVLSHAAWRRYFAGDRGAIGRTISFTGVSLFVGPVALGTAYSVIGVMPRGFYFPDDRVDFWTPGAPPREPRQRVPVIAELTEGVSMVAAAAELSAIVAGVRGARTPFAPTRFAVEAVANDVETPVRSALLVLMGA